MQRRELDRDAGPLVDSRRARRCRQLADGVDGVLVVGEVAAGLAAGDRGLAQHVVGVAEAPRLPGAAVVDRLLDGLAGDELLAHQAHRDVDAAADQRLAAARDQARQRRRQAALARGRGQPARHHQAPGRGVDEQRGALAEMRAPVAAADLVADQRVAGLVVGNAQQRLGEAHQRHALLARQRIFVDQRVDAGEGPGALGLVAQPLDQATRQCLSPDTHVRRRAVAASISGGRHSGSGRR